MRLYTVGCSFTYAQRKGWPDILVKKLQDQNINIDIVNNGHPGAGNLYISQKAILDSHDTKNANPDLVIIMWSGLTRKEILIDHKDELLMKTLDGYGFVRWSGQKTSYVLSGGMKGSWEHHPATKELFNPLYKISNERSMTQDTLVNILNLQNYLKNKNIPYIMSSYMNYWTDAERVGDQDWGIAKFEDLKYLVDQIDFSRWAFTTKHHFLNKDSIHELAKATPNGIQEDGFHPDFNVHELWADILLQKIIEDKLIS